MSAGVKSLLRKNAAGKLNAGDADGAERCLNLSAARRSEDWLARVR